MFKKIFILGIFALMILSVITLDSGTVQSTEENEVTIYALKDAEIREGTPDTNYSTGSFCTIADYSGNTIRGIIEFDLSEIPLYSTITSAKLEVNYTGLNDADPTGKIVWVYKLTQPEWVESQVTWNSYKTGETWTSAGGDYVTTDPNGSYYTIPSPTWPYWFEWNVLELVNDAYLNESPLELLLKFDAEQQEAGASWPTLSSARLIIKYQPPEEEEWGKLTLQPPTKDTYIHENNPETNYGGANVLAIRDRGGARVRTLLEFDISELPKGTTVHSAKLQLYFEALSGANPKGKKTYAFKLTRPDWIEDEATWENYKTSLAWSNAGGDYVTSNPKAGTMYFAGEEYKPAFGWVNWEIYDIVQDALNNEENLEILIRFGIEGITAEYESYPAFYSSEYVADPTLKPKLVIFYSYVPLPDEWGEVTIDLPTSDSFIREDNANINYGNLTVLEIRDRLDNVSRAFVQFDISELPENGEIKSAFLKIYYEAHADTDPFGKRVWVYKCTRPFVENEITWNEYKSGSSWTNSGGDYAVNNPPGGSAIIPSAHGWMSVDITEIVKDAYEDGEPVRLIIKFETEGLSEGHSIALFYSKEYLTDISLRPYLTIGIFPIWVVVYAWLPYVIKIFGIIVPFGYASWKFRNITNPQSGGEAAIAICLAFIAFLIIWVVADAIGSIVSGV